MGAPDKVKSKSALASFVSPVLLILVLLLLAAPQALAASPLKIREVFPGSTTLGANAEFVELQMTADGQSDIDGQQTAVL